LNPHDFCKSTDFKSVASTIPPYPLLFITLYYYFTYILIITHFIKIASYFYNLILIPLFLLFPSGCVLPSLRECEASREGRPSSPFPPLFLLRTQEGRGRAFSPKGPLQEEGGGRRGRGAPLLSSCFAPVPSERSRERSNLPPFGGA
jgi:hypothetical protein